MFTRINKRIKYSNDTLLLTSSNSNSNSNTQQSIETLNIEIDTNIINKRSSSSQQVYFKLCGKTRRLPKRGLGGILLSQILLIGGTIVHEILCYQMININNSDINVSSTAYIIFAIIGIITFLISQTTYFDTLSSIPGYQTSNRMSHEEYNKNPPQKVIKNVAFNLTYCTTCKLVRDIRTFHCNRCGMCIERHDHHCGFVSNCIGKDNLNKFFYFICATTLHSGFVSVISLYTFIKTVHTLFSSSHTTGNNTTGSSYALFSGVLALYIGCIFLSMLFMVIQHVFMFLHNETKNETIRHKYDNTVFNDGLSTNCREVFCNEESQFDPDEWKRSLNSIN